jgi:RNA 3'-terminal phosphate cyclase (ATP)
VLRTALALSVVTGRPFELTAIRARRSRPGLAPQHLHAVRVFRELSGATCAGDTEGSSELSFEPGAARAGSYRVDVGTAGSVTLILQAIALPLALADGSSAIDLRGGTHVPWSPPFNFIESCWNPFMRELGVELDVRLELAGFYPRGGGHVVARIEGGAKLKPLELTERGRLKSVEIVSAAATVLPSHVRQRQASRAHAGVRSAGCEASVQLVKLPSGSPGSVVAITGRFERTRVTTSALGARGKSAEAVGEEAAAEFREYLNRPGAVDGKLADQLVLPLGLAPGPSVYTTTRITEHLETNVETVRAFIDRPMEIEGRLGQPGRVVIG